MVTRKTANLQSLLWGAMLIMAIAPMMILAQDNAPVTEGDFSDEYSVPESPPNPNPTQRLISPRNHQSQEQQLSDEWECYDWARDETDWDPYEAYAELVDAGYAVTLTREDMQEGLICLAVEGAVIGSVAGEIVGDSRDGAEIGAAIAIASGVVRAEYLNQRDDPEAKRIVSRFERNLRNWDRKFAACLRPKGYRVPSS